MKIFRSLTVCAAFVTLGLPSSLLVRMPAAHAQAVVQVPEAKISLVAPTGYRKMERKDLPPQAQQAVLVYYGPVTDKFATNINLTIHPVPPGIKADAEAAGHLGDSIKETDPTYKQIATSTLAVNGEKGAYLVCSFTLQKRALQAKQVIFVHNGRAYDFCFMASPSAYAKQVGAFDKMVASVKWQ